MTSEKKMICPICRKDFVSSVPFRIYCSRECYVFARDHLSKEERLSFRRKLPKFNCRFCGKSVVPGENDRRFVFCSRECEKKWWRHPHDYKSGMRIVIVPKGAKK